MNMAIVRGRLSSDPPSMDVLQSAGFWLATGLGIGVLAGVHRPDAGRMRIDGDEWQVLVGRGHAPEMLCLYSAASNVLIAPA